MKKMNRKFVQISQTLLMTGCCGYTVSYLFFRSTVIPRIFTAILIVGTVLWFFSNRCPHCKKWQPVLNGKGENAGVCPGCGKVMEYK